MMNGVDFEDNSVFVYYHRLARVKDFVEKNYNKQISLDCAADVAGLEAKYFSAYFRKKTGMCFRDWLAGFRVRQSKSQMQAHNLSITEIAFQSGFRDLRTFERAFKNHADMTPSQYKNTVRPSYEYQNRNMSE